MKAKMEHLLVNNPNPVLLVAKDGTVLYSNEAAKPLLFEWGVETGEKLPGMHEGQQNKLEGKPTAKRMLRAIAGLEMTLSLIQVGAQQWWYLPPLPQLLVRVLDLLGLSTSLYTNLTNSSSRPPPGPLAFSVPAPAG